MSNYDNNSSSFKMYSKCCCDINPIQSTPEKPSLFLSQLMQNYPSLTDTIEQPNINSDELSKPSLFRWDADNSKNIDFNLFVSPSLKSNKNNQLSIDTPISSSTQYDDNEKRLFSWRNQLHTEIKSPDRTGNSCPINHKPPNKIISSNRTNNNSPTNETLHKKMKSANRSVNNSPTNETTWRSTSPTMNNEQPVFSWRSNDK
jgi:hypothetical protein